MRMGQENRKKVTRASVPLVSGRAYVLSLASVTNVGLESRSSVSQGFFWMSVSSSGSICEMGQASCRFGVFRFRLWNLGT